MPDQPVSNERYNDAGPVAASLVPTRHGPARLIASLAEKPSATLVLGHGAGGGAQAPDLRWLAEDLPATGINVVRVEQPWRVAGGRVAPRTQTLDQGWLDALAQLPRVTPLIVGGRSSGARVACRTAASVGAIACLALAFPLHPPWRPQDSRIAELLGSGVPTLVVQGDRDAFGPPTAFPPLPQSIRIEPLIGADHQFVAPRGSGRNAAVLRAELVGCARNWIREMIPGL